MRKINWEEKLSDDDITWIRQAGVMNEEQIERHQSQFDVKVPDPEVPKDTATQSALNPQASASTPTGQQNGPLLVDPTQEDPQSAPDADEDDYDSWKIPELEAEVKARNEMPNTSQVEVTGTGSQGKVTKADLVKGLRLWDQENPEALA